MTGDTALLAARADLQARFRELYAAGVSQRTIAARLRIATSTASRWAFKAGPRDNGPLVGTDAIWWTPERLRELIALKRAHLTEREIADRMGASLHSMRKKWRAIRAQYRARGLPMPTARPCYVPKAPAAGASA